jgi:hypothetical protein
MEFDRSAPARVATRSVAGGGILTLMSFFDAAPCHVAEVYFKDSASDAATTPWRKPNKTTTERRT